MRYFSAIVLVKISVNKQMFALVNEINKNFMN